ncbi:FkbM family methyltransferase [Azorhizobium doebereinerae]|uniref:FkbM family methyltransferase n=1 Tax=Azorhizobium doebereinerae TaxID=281091 RepID=UPI00041457BA|nr:FkbM family methyltransferase [Azorhizobium doebereinerae]
MLGSLSRTLSHILKHPFNRGREGEALLRYLRWQFASRLATGPILVDFVAPMKLCVTPGMTGATLNIYTGLAEFDDMAFVLHALRPGDAFLDVGANVGAYSLLAAAAGARVIAVEPAPAACRWLALNVRVNDLGARVEIVPAALGRAAGSVRFTAGQDTLNHVAEAGETADAVTVPVERLDDVAARGGDVPRIIKIDVEGYETEVLAGADRTLASPDLLAVILELNGSGARYGFDDAALGARMSGLGFRPCRYDAAARVLSPLDQPNAAQNTLFVRDRAEVERRLARAPRFRVQGREV